MVGGEYQLRVDSEGARCEHAPRNKMVVKQHTQLVICQTTSHVTMPMTRSRMGLQMSQGSGWDTTQVT